MSLTDKPLAAPGLCSYRYRGPYDWIMIGARDDEDALSEARRSLSSASAFVSRLQKWDGEQYVWCTPVQRVTDNPALSLMMANQFNSSSVALLRGIDRAYSCAIRLALLQAYQEGALQEARLPEPASHRALISARLFGDEAREAVLEAWRYYGNTDRHLSQAQQAIFGDSDYTSPWLSHDVLLSTDWSDFGRFSPLDRLHVVTSYLEGANTKTEVPWADELWDDGPPDWHLAALQDWKAVGYTDAAHALDELARDGAVDESGDEVGAPPSSPR